MNHSCACTTNPWFSLCDPCRITAADEVGPVSRSAQPTLYGIDHGLLNKQITDWCQQSKTAAHSQSHELQQVGGKYRISGLLEHPLQQIHTLFKLLLLNKSVLLLCNGLIKVTGLPRFCRQMWMNQIIVICTALRMSAWHSCRSANAQDTVVVLYNEWLKCGQHLTVLWSSAVFTLQHGWALYCVFWFVSSGAAVGYRGAQETTNHQEEEEEGEAARRWHFTPGLSTGSTRHGHTPRAGSETKRGGARGRQCFQGGGSWSTRTLFPGGKEELITDESQLNDVPSCMSDG